MSCILTLTSVAVMAGISLLAGSTVMITEQISNGTLSISDGIDTIFVDSEILQKALSGFDCCVDAVSENEFIVKTANGNIRYARENSSEAFKMYFNDIQNVEELLNEIQSFEVDYGRNVQAYTYSHIKENLSDGMTVVNDEILDDDSLLLTINIE